MKFALSLAVAAASIASTAMGQIYSNDFSSPATAADFAADRANPGGFAVAGGVLNLNVTGADPFGSSGFYDFHGIQTGPVGDFGAGRGALLSVDLLVPNSWNAATAERGGDLWARIDDPTQTVGNDYYPSIGVWNYGDGSGAKVSLFSSSAGGFDGNPVTDDNILDLPAVAINFGAYNTLGLKFTATGIDYLFNNVVVASDTDAGYLIATTLDQAFLQGYQGDIDYTVTFDNLAVSPEPTTLAALAGASVLGLRRRRA